MKIGIKLALFTSLIIVASILTISGLATGAYARSAQEVLVHHMESDATHIIHSIDRAMFERISDMGILSDKSHPIMSGSAHTLEEKMWLLSRFEKSGSDSISLYDKNGIKIGDTKGLMLGIDESQKPFFQEAIQGKVYHDKIPVMSESLNAKVIHFSGPIYDDFGNVNGAIVARMPMESINEIIKESAALEGIEEHVELDLVSEDGLVIFSNHRPESAVKESLAALEVFQKIKASGNQMEALVVDDGGEEELYAAIKEPEHKTYEGSGWILITDINTGVIFAEVNRVRGFIAMLATGIAALAIIGMIYFARSITNPMQDLARASRQIRRGHLAHKVKIKSNDEIGELAGAFEDMRLGLKDRAELFNSLYKTFEGKFGNIATILVRKNVQDIVDKNPRIYKILPRSLSKSVKPPQKQTPKRRKR